MTRNRSLFVALCLAAMVFVASAASAQTVHFVGAGSSAQFLESALAADKLAVAKIGVSVTQCPYHWVANGSGAILDARSSLIQPESGNTWIVWIADCTVTSPPGANNVTDVWMMVSVDSTVGVRAFLAQASGQPAGDTVSVTAGPPTSPAVIAQALWQDNTADVSTIVGNTTLLTAINGNPAHVPPIPAQHVNAGMTDIRAEDALFATTRSLAILNTTTYAGLGYRRTPVNANIGAPILSTKSGSSANATPVKFALHDLDPISHTAVRSYNTVPIGAAPIMFIANNGGSLPYALNLVSNISVTPNSNATKYAERLFGGIDPCTTTSLAFGSGNRCSGGTAPNNDGAVCTSNTDCVATGAGVAGTCNAVASADISLFLREPLSGTMNTVEFDVFRTKYNSTGSQEVGVNPAAAGGNPLNLACSATTFRQRGIGTGEIRDMIFGSGTPSLGYVFFSFATAKKYAGGTAFNYLTVDGVDPFYPTPATVNQIVPNCTATQCPAVNITSPAINSFWGSSTTPNSYPNLRNGTYKVWSLYRWLVDASDVDTYGPTALAQAAQDTVDVTVADFVPFQTSGAALVADGLDVYRSHFTRTGQIVGGTSNGPVVGDTRGGGTCPPPACENGGDEGGLIEGPFPRVYSGLEYLTTNTLMHKNTTNIPWTTGAFNGLSVVINGTATPTGCTGGTAYPITSNTAAAITLTAPGDTGDLPHTAAHKLPYCIAVPVSSSNVLMQHQ